MQKCFSKLGLIASSDAELLKVLAQIDISVPKRGEGRTKNHVEQYAIAHLLSTLAAENVLSYPLNLAKRERPDFLLTINAKKIGIELIEAVHPYQAHKTALRGKGYGPDMYFISHHQPEDTEPEKPKMLHKKRIREIETNQPYNGWIGDSVEKEWADAMLFFIEKKTEKLLNGFDRFEEDWLLIYDNWGLPALNIYEATSIMLARISKSVAMSEFKRIYIIAGKYICDISSAGMQFYNINDLWNCPA
jgi:hypothetical protein